jgi:hypothetical protein
MHQLAAILLAAALVTASSGGGSRRPVPTAASDSAAAEAENRLLRQENRRLKQELEALKVRAIAVPAVSATAGGAGASDYFRVSVLDGATGKGVPLVQLRTGNYINHWSDNAGNVAFNEPGMMDMPVFFSVLSDGYNFTGGVAREPIQDDPRGTDPGVALLTTRGGSATIYLNRTQVAQRVYRLTGGGRWRDTMLAGAPLPPQAQGDRAVLDSGGPIGQDSVLTAEYKGKVYWMFGDTACPRSARDKNCASYGMYTVGATSCIPSTNGTAAPAPTPTPTPTYATPGWLGSGSVSWNAWSQRYIFMAGGDTIAPHQSAGGSMHMAFSWSLDGPWVNATLVGDHNSSGGSCYNGLHLPSLDAEGGRVVHLACTYTAMWSNTIVKPWVWSTCLFGLNAHQDCGPVVPRYE